MADSNNFQHTKIEEWSDRRCLKIALQESFPAVVGDLKVQKNILSRYLNFYLGGKIQKGLSAVDLSLAVISIMPISSDSEEFIWPQSEYSENGNLFFLTPDDKLKYDINYVVNKKTNDKDNAELTLGTKHVDKQVDEQTDAEAFKQINLDIDNAVNSYDTLEDPKIETVSNSYTDITILEHINSEMEMSNIIKSDKPTDKLTKLYEGNLLWHRTRFYENSYNLNEEKQYDPVKNAAFCIYFNHLLDTWETSLQSRISLKYFFAMVALVVLRSKVKSFQNLSKYFSIRFVNSSLPSNIECYTAPHKGFIKKSWKSFRENDPRSQIMFAKLVKNSLLHPDRMNKHGKINIIKFAVLSHTAYSGMGIINMMQQLASCNHFAFKTLFKKICTKETVVSWNRVNDFFKKYLCQEAKQYTFHWANNIESGVFRHLSCSNNYELAVVVAVFIEKMTENVGVWQSAWVAKGNDLEIYKQLGNKLYEEYTQSQHLIFERFMDDISYDELDDMPLDSCSVVGSD